MATKPEVPTTPTTPVVAEPKTALKARLVEITMANKRFAPDQAWMKDALISALDTRLTAKLAEISDEECSKVLTILDLSK